MNTKAIFSSKRDDWETPQSLFDELDAEFHFNLDPCSDGTNNKCDKYFTKDQNGLIQDWGGYTVFCNPPYGREIQKWVKKSYESDADSVVMLLPARTDTGWFHDYIYGKAEIRFIRGRLHFCDCKNSAPFPSMIVIYRRKESGHE